MKIGLIDVDNHNFPNLSLMKLSAYHKALGDDVEFVKPFGEYDIVYKAKVFTFTEDSDVIFKANKIIRGGTGYDLTTKLPNEVEHIYPNYDLYGITDTAYGFLSRGCPRGCDFCIVATKEGKGSKKVANLHEWWSGQKNIVLLDPNIFACPNYEELMQQLIDSKAYIDYNQGIDIRLMTEHKADLINQTKWKTIHFAWDNPKDNFSYEQFKKYAGIFKKSMRSKQVYVLTNFNSTLDEDLFRIYALKELGYSPYVMIYDKPNASQIIRRLQRYVNNRFLFWSKYYEDFDDYCRKTYKS